MLDLDLLRRDAADVARRLAVRGTSFDFAEILELDRRRRELVTRFEQRRGELNSTSKEVPRLKKSGQDAEPLIRRMKELGETIAGEERAAGEIEEKLKALWLGIPNIPLADVPAGKDEKDNRELRRWGVLRKFDFAPLSHDDLGKKLGVMSGELGVKLAKARFTLLRGAAARLERALLNFMLDRNSARGYEEILPPFLANASCLTGTGQLPKFAADLFKVENEDLYLIPTAEVPLTNILADTVLKDLTPGQPLRYTAYTPCFRSEAGSYGKDTKGYLRQHQFNKVELVKICHPEGSEAEHESLTHDAEALLQELELPYRVVSLCGGDLGFSAARTYDLEVWLPAQDCYREISSCSTFTDFQARRAGIRFKDPGGKSRFPHTLNGSALAVGRTLVAIFENHQTGDGNVVIPPALRPYMGGREMLV